MERLGRYQLVRKLATGGMAELYLARAEGPGGFAKNLVVKRILPELAENDEFVQMFLTEAKVAAQLDHPNIVQIFDFGQADGSYFIAMEYVDGPNLRNLVRWSLQAGAIPLALCARIICAACEGLAYAHEFVDPETHRQLHLVHRDVSTENLVLARNGTVKVLDFGIARVGKAEGATKAGAVKGKISYMPPEQIRAQDIDRRADVYALGVVLYQLLTGRKPYDQKDEISLMAAVLSEAPVPIEARRPDLPAELGRIVARAMARDREARYPSCRALQADLERFVAQTGEQAGSLQLAELVARFQASGLATGAGSPSTSLSPSHSLSDRPKATKPTRRFPTLPPPPPPDALVSPRAVVPPRPLVPASAPPIDHLAAAEAVGTVRVLPYTPFRVAIPPIQEAVEGTLIADRSRKILRKFPRIAARLLEATTDVPWPIYETVAGVIDAALLSEDHALLLNLLQRVEVGESPDMRLPSLVHGELGGPLRMLWLVERLRFGVPADAASLKAWLVWLGRPMATRLMWAIDALEPGPGQDVLADALGTILTSDPSAIVARVSVEAPRNLAAYCLALERAQYRGRAKLYQQILQRRDPSQQMQLLSARAHAGGPDSVGLLVGSLSDRLEDVRRHVLKLLAEVGDERVVDALGNQVLGPTMEARAPAERVALWTALTAGRESALPLFERALSQKTTLLNRKRSVEAKLPAVEALAEMRLEGAGSLLSGLCTDPAQPDEIREAAARALGRHRARLAGEESAEARTVERRPFLGRALCLHLLYFARASTAIDLRSDLLDGAIERFREDLRQGVEKEGKIRLLVGQDGVTLNGVSVGYGLPGEELGAEVAKHLRVRDFRGLALAGALHAKELRSLLLWLFDPAGGREEVSAGRVATFSGRAPLPTAEPQLAADPAARARELYLQAIALLKRGRETLLAGKPAATGEATPLLEEWARLYASGGPHLLGVAMASTADSAFAAHAANTVVLGLAFGADLGLKHGELIELAELAYAYCLHFVLLPREKQPAAGHAAPEELRMRVAGTFLAQLRNRRGASYAVAAMETGSETPRSQGMLASLLSLVEAWDALTMGAGLTPALALDAMNGPLRARFHPELLGLFSQWARAQAGLPQT